jgi:hypothetical protein
VEAGVTQQSQYDNIMTNTIIQSHSYAQVLPFDSPHKCFGIVIALVAIKLQSELYTSMLYYILKKSWKFLCFSIKSLCYREGADPAQNMKGPLRIRPSQCNRKKSEPTRNKISLGV